MGKLLQQGAAVDLKKWVASIDLAADRAGLVLCHDLPTAIELIRASDEASSSVPITERVKEAVLYSVSEAYFKTRARLHVAIDS